jgi:hypothetical protein
MMMMQVEYCAAFYVRYSFRGAEVLDAKEGLMWRPREVANDGRRALKRYAGMTSCPKRAIGWET